MGSSLAGSAGREGRGKRERERGEREEREERERREREREAEAEMVFQVTAALPKKEKRRDKKNCPSSCFPGQIEPASLSQG